MKPWIVDPRAAEEIDDTAGWYEDRREGLGFAFLESLDQTLILIADHPEAFARLRIGPLSTKLSIRKALLHRFPYAVVFLELPDELRLLAVAHQKRQPGYWLDRVD